MGFWSLYVAFNYRIDCNNLRIGMAIQTYVYKITGRECRRAGWLIILSSLFLINLCIFNVFLYSACSSTFITKFIYWRWLFTVVSFVKRKQTVLLLPLWSVTLLSVFYSLGPTMREIEINQRPTKYPNKQQKSIQMNESEAYSESKESISGKKAIQSAHAKGYWKSYYVWCTSLVWLDLHGTLREIWCLWALLKQIKINVLKEKRKIKSGK